MNQIQIYAAARRPLIDLGQLKHRQRRSRAQDCAAPVATAPATIMATTKPTRLIEPIQVSSARSETVFMISLPTVVFDFDYLQSSLRLK
jgi:hypothetical protein